MERSSVRNIRVLLLLILCCAWSCLSAAGDAHPFSTLQELKGAISSISKPQEADRFWNRVLTHKTMPIIFQGDALFLWRGRAETVEWRGDFSSWESTSETKGQRIKRTDIWMYERSFPLDARLDYKIVINGNDWQLDPLNPNRQLGGYGPNSEVRMPDWQLPAHVFRKPDVAAGAFSADIPIQSAKLGYVVNYRVYTPAGFNEKTSKDLPVLYVTDGSDYWADEMGGLVITLDNLIANKEISPVLAVFIDPWDRKQNINRRESQYVPGEDRSCSFCEFLVDELIPAIDARFPTLKNRHGRAIVGASYGGLLATLMIERHGAVFGMFGIQSPAYWPNLWILDEIKNLDVLPDRIFVSAGTFEEHIPDNSRKLRDILEARQVNILYKEVNEGHSWGNWRALLDDMLRYFYKPASTQNDR